MFNLKLKNSRAFTLIEVMLSIFLLGMIIAYLYGTLGELSKSNEVLQKREENLIKEERFINLLRRDLFEAREVYITETVSKNSLLSIRTKNSLYNSGLTNVVWFLNIEEAQLVRAESLQTITLPVSLEKEHLVHFESFYLMIDGIDKIENFKIYASSDKKSILLAIKPLLGMGMNISDKYYIRSLPIAQF